MPDPFRVGRRLSLRNVTWLVLAAFIGLAAGFLMGRVSVAPPPPRPDLLSSVARLEEEKKRVQGLEEARRRFLGNVSHSLKTPLAAIKGWAETVHDGISQDPKADLARIIRQATLLTRTVSRLIELSRLEADPGHVALRPFALVEPVMDAVAVVSPAAELRQISLTLQGPLSTTTAMGDPERVRDLVVVLLENAVQHAGDGASVCLEVAPVVDGRVKVSVSDNGPGIAPELLPKVLDRYVTEGGGSGIGLALANSLAVRHGAHLEVESEAGKGARFSFSLAVAAAQT